MISFSSGPPQPTLVHLLWKSNYLQCQGLSLQPIRQKLAYRTSRLKVTNPHLPLALQKHLPAWRGRKKKHRFAVPFERNCSHRISTRSSKCEVVLCHYNRAETRSHHPILLSP